MAYCPLQASTGKAIGGPVAMDIGSIASVAAGAALPGNVEQEVEWKLDEAA